MEKTLNKKSRTWKFNTGVQLSGSCRERDLGRCRKRKGRHGRPSYCSSLHKNEREVWRGRPSPPTAAASSLVLADPWPTAVEQMTEWLCGDRQAAKWKEGWNKQQPTTTTMSPGFKHQRWWPKCSVSTETIPKHASIQKLLCPPLHLKS